MSCCRWTFKGWIRPRELLKSERRSLFDLRSRIGETVSGANRCEDIQGAIPGVKPAAGMTAVSLCSSPRKDPSSVFLSDSI